MSAAEPVFLPPATWHNLLMGLSTGEHIHISTKPHGLVIQSPRQPTCTLANPVQPILQICALWGLLEAHATCTTMSAPRSDRAPVVRSWDWFMRMGATPSFCCLDLPGANLSFTTNLSSTSFWCAPLRPHSHHAQVQRAAILRPIQDMHAFPDHITARVRARHPQLG